MNYLQTPIPAKTKSYTPVPHSDLITLVDERLDHAGFERSYLDVDQNQDGTIIIANMGIKRNENEFFSQQLSIVNSYNKVKPVGFAAGARVFVCSNGMVISETYIVRKHTTNVWDQLTERADQAIAQLTTNWEKTLVDVNKMREKELTFTQSSELLGRIFVEKEILKPRQANEVARQLRNPRFSEFKEMTLWSLYNACTFSLKEAQPKEKNARLKHLHDFCLELV